MTQLRTLTKDGDSVMVVLYLTNSCKKQLLENLEKIYIAATSWRMVFASSYNPC